MSENIKDMTSGKPAGLLIRFALPMMVGNVFQQMYTMVDTAVVGRFVGVEALAAMGVADWVNWMVWGAIFGFTQGFSILMAQRFGAGDYQGLRKVIGVSTTLTVGITLAVMAIALAGCLPLLRLLETPENIRPYAFTYMMILYGGTLMISLYNLLASILRALGDSKTPLYAMLLSAGINIGLDLLFVSPLGWGVAGAAVATVIAQACAGLFCLRAVWHIDILTLQRTDFIPEKQVTRALIRLGGPLAFQNTIISVGGLVVQRVVNGFGFILVAGMTAANKLYGILEMAAISYGSAISTYVGQNLGAGKVPRIKEGMGSGLRMAIVTAVAVGGAVLLFGRALLTLFVSGEPEVTAQVLEVGYTYLTTMACGLPILYLLHMYRSALQGMGDTVIPMTSGFVELAMRISAALLLPILVGQKGIYFCEVLAWAGAATLLCVSYYVRIRQLTARGRIG